MPHVEPLKAKVRDMEKQQAKTTKLLADLNDQLGVLSKELGHWTQILKRRTKSSRGCKRKPRSWRSAWRLHRN